MRLGTSIGWWGGGLLSESVILRTPRQWSGGLSEPPQLGMSRVWEGVGVGSSGTIIPKLAGTGKQMQLKGG